MRHGSKIVALVLGASASCAPPTEPATCARAERPRSPPGTNAESGSAVVPAPAPCPSCARSTPHHEPPKWDPYTSPPPNLAAALPTFGRWVLQVGYVHLGGHVDNMLEPKRVSLGPEDPGEISVGGGSPWKCRASPLEFDADMIIGRTLRCTSDEWASWVEASGGIVFDPRTNKVASRDHDVWARLELRWNAPTVPPGSPPIPPWRFEAVVSLVPESQTAKQRQGPASSSAPNRNGH